MVTAGLREWMGSEGAEIDEVDGVGGREQRRQVNGWFDRLTGLQRCWTELQPGLR